MPSAAIAYNSDLALHNIATYKSGKSKAEECVPEDLTVGEEYSFLKKGHRNYQIDSIVTLLEMKPDDILFNFRALVEIKATEYLIEDKQSYTSGRYKVQELLESSSIYHIPTN